MSSKTISNLLTTTTLALAFTACSSDADLQTPDQTTSEPKEIRLFSQVAGPATRAVDNAADLQDTQLANGTKITVKVKENATPTTVDYALATYTADGSGGLSLPAGVKQYYPASGNGVNIYAFHPMGVAQTFEVKTDQTTDANYKASDLMWASLSNITAASTPAQRTLAFDHLLSKIVVTLVNTAGITDDALATATVTLGNDNLVTSGTFTASTGTFTPASSGTGTITLATNAGAATYAAIVVPQTASGKKINVKIGDQTSNYTISTATFEAGKRYTYVLTVGISGTLSLLKAEITDWQNVQIIKSM